MLARALQSTKELKILELDLSGNKFTETKAIEFVSSLGRIGLNRLRLSLGLKGPAEQEESGVELMAAFSALPFTDKKLVNIFPLGSLVD